MNASTQNTSLPESPAKPKKGPLFRTAYLMLALALVLLVRNALSAYNSLELNPGATFFDLFFSITDFGGDIQPLWVLWVWGPFVLIPLGLMLGLIARLRSRRTR
jgi:hypothetical protein